MSILSGHKPIAKELLHRGSDFELVNKNGLTCAHLAVRFPECLAALLKFHPNIEVKDSFGRTPLFYAVKLNSEQSVRLLIFKGANLDIVDNNGKSLYKASSLLNQSVLKQIVKEKYPFRYLSL